MSDPRARRRPRSRRAVLLVAVLGLLLSGCGGSSGVPEPDPPVGHALLPDLVPVPPANVRMSVVDKRWFLAFDSTMANVGKGDFVLRAVRSGAIWHVVQDVPYSTSGAKPARLRGTLVWGGDGHNHWHIAGVATTRLVPLGAVEGGPERGGRVDSKVGFCFFDYAHLVRAQGPEKAVFSRRSCGHREDTSIEMGLSPGWVDTYPWTLPGQSVDVSGLRDGVYRLWAVVDQDGLFREATRANNVTWVDVKLSTRGSYRFAQVVKTGPSPA